MESPIKIAMRPAGIHDLELLKFWDTKQHVKESDPEDDWNWEVELLRKPLWREQWIAEVNEIPIGFLQIIDPFEEETHYWGEVVKTTRALDIWIGEESYLNKGYGSQMMQWAIARCFQFPNVTTLLIDPLKSNVKAHRFYKRLGFTFLEERIFDGLACYVFELSK